MATGTVKWINPVKGWICSTGRGGKDVFVHISAVERAVRRLAMRKPKIPAKRSRLDSLRSLIKRGTNIGLKLLG